MSDSISNKQQRFNEVVSAIKSISDEEVEKVVTYFHIEKNVPVSEIAKALGCSRQVLYQRFPNLMKAKKEATA